MGRGHSSAPGDLSNLTAQKARNTINFCQSVADFLQLAELSEMGLNNPRIPYLCSTECKDLWRSSRSSLRCPSSASVRAHDPQVVRARDAGAASPSPAAEQSPGQGDTITCLSYLFEVQKMSLSLLQGTQWEHQEKIQNGKLILPVFSTILTHLKQFICKQSVLLPGQISCHVSMPKPRCIICLAIMQTTSSQPESKAQLMWVLESREPKNIPIEKTPRLHNPTLFLNVSTFSNRSIASSGCFLISVLKYFSCK